MPKRHSVFIAAVMLAAATLGGTATATADSMSDHDDHRRGCPIFVENHRGDVEIEYVRTGTRSGDFVCRLNGEWEHR